MAESRNPTLEGSSSVSALGLRWAALRGMLASPLIDADDQRSLKDELLRELQAIEQDFASLPARTPVEISAKIDVVKTALRQVAVDAPGWLTDLLDSVQTDLRSGNPRPQAMRYDRPPVNLSRAFQPRPEPAPVVAEQEQPAA